jgi:PAS domain S-box-containing protein
LDTTGSSSTSHPSVLNADGLAMNRPLKVLILEDVEADAELMVHELKHAGFLPDWIRVDTENSYLIALASDPDLILSDYNLPQFDAFLALQLMQAQKLDIPFIVISGTITEDAAVEFMKRGASDYLLKDRMARLGQAVVRALEQRELREEKRRTEEALRESEALYSAVIGQAFDMIFLVDVNTRFIVDGNIAFQEMLGFSSNDLSGLTLYDIVAHDKESIERNIDRIKESGNYFIGPRRYRRKDGTTIDMEVSSSLIRYGMKEVLCVIARDITKRKNAEEALRKSIQLQEKVYSSLHDALFIIEANSTKIIDCNPAASDMFGYSREDMLTQSTGFLHASNDSLDLFRVRLQSAIAENGFLFLPEFQMKRKDGTIFFTEHSVVPLTDEEGANIGWVSIVRDITERKRTEGAIHESQATLINLMDSMPVGIQGYDVEGTVFYWNKMSAQIYGYDAEEAIGRKLGDLIIPDEIKPMYLEALAQAATLEESCEFLPANEVSLLRKDGSRVCVHSIHTAVCLPEKTPMLFCIDVDLTERRHAEEALIKKSEDLARSNADLAQFAYVASHDLQEPLRMVTSYVQLIEKRYSGKLDPDADEFIGYVVEGAKRMKQLLTALLDYSRIGTRGNCIHTVECETVLETALQNLRMVLEETRGTVTHDPLPAIMADETQMVQLFQNIIGNGLKFHGPQPPLIHISAKQEGTNWIFTFQDNGIGIDPQYFKKIFVIFQRLHGRDKYPGTGIGLTIAKKIVERYGGRIWVESDKGKGTAFYFTVPCNA